jgi:hypothetical protein
VCCCVKTAVRSHTTYADITHCEQGIKHRQRRRITYHATPACETVKREIMRMLPAAVAWAAVMLLGPESARAASHVDAAASS